MVELNLQPLGETCTASTAQARRPIAQAAPKARLRDSCHACSSSKVKCHKEKPTCSRCANRGITCEYNVTKRPGRRRGNDNNQNNSTASINLPSPPSSTPQSASNTSYAEFFNATIASADSASIDFDSLDLPSLVSTSHDDPTFSSAPSLFDHDDFLSSPISFPEPERSFDPMHNSRDLAAISPKASTFSVFGDVFPDCRVSKANSYPPSSSSYGDTTISTSRAPPVSRADSSNTDSDNPASSCSCLARALSLIKPQVPITSNHPDSTLSYGSENYSLVEATVGNKNPRVRAVVVENQQTVEVISGVLQCPSFHDFYLLTILALAVFKVLDCYETVARAIPSSSSSSNEPFGQDGRWSPSSSSSGLSSDLAIQQHQRPGYSNDGDDQRRMAAQLVLGQLHKVQRVVNQLSPRLKSQAAMQKDGAVADSQVSLIGPTNGSRTVTSPFSARTSDHIESDLRKRLRGISIEIIEMLRHT